MTKSLVQALKRCKKNVSGFTTNKEKRKKIVNLIEKIIEFEECKNCL